MADGGGVPGMAAGTVHAIMTGAGLFIPRHHIFTEAFLHSGEMITGIVIGKDIAGNPDRYRSATFKGTGTAGKETGVGKNRTGVFRDCTNDRPSPTEMTGEKQSRVPITDPGHNRVGVITFRVWDRSRAPLITGETFKET